MESRTAMLDVPAEDWAEVERWSLRAQALAELRELSDREPGAAGVGSHLPRAIVLP